MRLERMGRRGRRALSPAQTKYRGPRNWDGASWPFLDRATDRERCERVRYR